MPILREKFPALSPLFSRWHNHDAWWPLVARTISPNAGIFAAMSSMTTSEVEWAMGIDGNALSHLLGGRCDVEASPLFGYHGFRSPMAT